MLFFRLCTSFCFRRKGKMNKISLSVLVLSLLLLFFVACDALGHDDTASSNATMTESVETETNLTVDDTTSSEATMTENVETETNLTVDAIIQLFDKKVFYIQKYDSSMIATICQNISSMGLSLNGEILEIVHITDQSVSREDPNWSWAYIYEFSNEEDAIAFEDNRRTFVISTEENGACIRCGKIVVFGSASVIPSIEQE